MICSSYQMSEPTFKPRFWDFKSNLPFPLSHCYCLGPLQIKLLLHIHIASMCQGQHQNLGLLDVQDGLLSIMTYRLSSTIS